MTFEEEVQAGLRDYPEPDVDGSIIMCSALVGFNRGMQSVMNKRGGVKKKHIASSIASIIVSLLNSVRESEKANGDKDSILPFLMYAIEKSMSEPSMENACHVSDIRPEGGRA